MTTRQGFTLVELLVVVAVIALILAILLPALQSAKITTRITTCKANVQQLSYAWVVYASNNDEQLVNGSTHGANPWAKYGNESPDNPNRLTLVKTGALYRYVNNVDAFLCPADRVKHIRSYSIGTLMNAWDWGNLPYASTTFEIKGAGFQMVFIDENDYRSNSNMGSYAQDPKNWGRNRWVDYVANYHNDGDNLGFADGHAEYWQWQESETLKASHQQRFFWPDNGNTDLERLRRAMFTVMPGAY